MVKTKGQIISDGNSVCNGVLRNLDVRVTGHFGNVVSLSGICDVVVSLSGICDVEGGGCVSPFGLYGTTSNIGYIIKELVELLDLTDEDGFSLSDLKDVPVRLIFKGTAGLGDKCVGIGNLLKNKFVYTDELMKTHIPNE